MALNTYSLNLDTGTTDYASIANASCANLEIASDITVEAWVRPTNVAGGWAKGYILSKWVTAVGGYYLALGGGTLPRFYGMGLTTNAYVEATGVTCANNQWYHIAGVHNSSSNKLSIYVNGILINEAACGGTIGDGNSAFYIGLNSNDTGQGFEGYIDEVRVWNDVRTADEIKDNMYNDVTGQANLQGYWKFNNDYTDASPNGYTLSASGTPSFSTTTFFPEYRTSNPIAISDLPLLSDANLKAYYKFDSGALTTDSKGSYTLTNNNSVPESSGLFGGAASQGSSNATNKCFTSTSSVGFGSGSYSIVGWVKFNAIAATCPLFDTADTSTDVFTRTQWYQPSNYLTFYRVKNGVAQQGPNFPFIPTTGIWYHVANVYDGVNCKGYINGVLCATGAASGSGSLNQADAIVIGSDAQSPTTTSGTLDIDDVAFFNRELTATEIYNLYIGKEPTGGYIFQSY